MSTTSPATSLQPPSVESVIKRRNPLRNEHKEVLDAITLLDRLALWITIRVGSMGFFLTVLGWDGLLVGLECAGPSGVAVRSADGLCVLAVHF